MQACNPILECILFCNVIADVVEGHLFIPLLRFIGELPKHGQPSIYH